ncbi:hypothetical protein [Reticulibacter mediterranei]|uniref:hypothetical protein n=1 Tax=Reticulibacter mediterranei TaxID=2778369 RepID=UPI001C688A86|nr:hypothetical protein [Reticulibacter mediterranei]
MEPWSFMPGSNAALLSYNYSYQLDDNAEKKCLASTGSEIKISGGSCLHAAHMQALIFPLQDHCPYQIARLIATVLFAAAEFLHYTIH